MKKNWKKGVLALLCGFIALSAGGFVACDGSTPPPDGPGQEGPATPSAIATPAITFTENGAEWSAVQGATAYRYKINGGAAQMTTQRVVTLQENDIFEVMAVGDGDKNLDSPWSATVQYTWFKLDKPVVSLTGNRASWTAVDNAVGYTYQINGGEEEYTEDLYVDLTDGQSVRVKAVAGGYPHKDSSYSAYTKAYQAIEITVVAGNGGTVTGSGRYEKGATAMIEAIPNAGYKFVRWSDDNTNASRIITVTEAKTYTAIFELAEYVVSVSCESSQGTVVGNNVYYYGAKATISAEPKTGYDFVRWSDGDTNATREFTVTGDVSLTAEFAIKTYTVTVVAGNGGTVTGSGTYDHGAKATLTATPDVGYTFVKWSDGNTNATREITVTADKNLTAEFTNKSYTISVTAGNGGKVTGAGKYNHGASVTLTATPDEGYNFVKWSDGSTEITRTFEATEDKTLTAEFAIKTYDISATCDTSKGSITGAGTYDHGATVTLKATPKTGFKFVKWSDGVTNATRTFTATADKTLTAEFAVQTYTVTIVKKVSGVVVTDNLVGKVTGDGTYNHGENGTLTAETLNKKDYVFAGWYNGNILLEEDETYTLTDISEDKVITAKWELHAVELTLLSDFDIAGTVEGAGTYSVGHNVQLMVTPRQNYTFLGWYNESDALLSNQPSFLYQITKDTTITAKWRDDWVNVTTSTALGYEHKGYAYYTMPQHDIDVMPIVGFNSPNAKTTEIGADIAQVHGSFPSQINDTNYQMMKDAGINTIVGWWNDWMNGNLQDDIMQELDLAEKYGISYIVSHRDAMYVDNKDDFEDNSFRYMKKPAYGGTILIDEPGAVNFADIATATRVWEGSNYKDTLAYVNMLPNYAAGWQLNDCQGTGGTYTGPSYSGYEQWIQRYLEIVKPQVLSYDHYPYLFTQPSFFRDGWYSNLSNVRFWSAAHGVPYWVYGQLGGWPEYGQTISSTTKHLTFGHTALQFNSMLSYGAKGIQYYNYFMPPNYVNAKDYTSATLADGTPTPFYAQIQRINKQVAAIDDVLMRCAWKGIVQLNSSPAPISDGDKVSSYEALSSASASGNAIVGCFEYRDIGWAYYVTTNDVFYESTVTLNFNGNYNLRKVQNGVSTETRASSITMTIDAGDGVLVVVPKN